MLKERQRIGGDDDDIPIEASQTVQKLHVVGLDVRMHITDAGWCAHLGRVSQPTIIVSGRQAKVTLGFELQPYELYLLAHSTGIRERNAAES